MNNVYEFTHVDELILNPNESASARPWGRYSGNILQALTWVLSALYLAGATALGGAIVYYTFVR